MPREEYNSETATEDVPIIEPHDIEEIRRDIRKIFEDLPRLPKAREIGIDTTPPLES